MKILVAPNALKGSVDALGAAKAIASGLRRALPDATIVPLPIADGGDGTAAVLAHALGGTLETAPSSDALGRSIVASWGLLPDGTAIVDVASASGIARISASERDPLRARSDGTGDLMRAALDRGCRKF